VTMVVGSLGAVAQVSWRRILSFSNVGQVGYLAFALGLFTPASLAALVYYVVHHVIVKFALFLVAGVAERLSGREDVRQGGWLERAPALAGAFGLLALGLIGLPPTSGFIGKFSLVRAGIDAATPLALVVTAIAVATSLLTLLAMLGVWRGFFWGTPVRARPAAVRAPIEMTGTTAVMVAVSLAVAVLAGPLFSLASSVAQELADPARYIAAVLP
ncbi:MAG TPA: proton-conducting transporter membrane subunit, partial [Deinococcales bacterium]|nr:proton-conducting transporter membrane subunit [Deinococcales bacterium]